MNWKDTSEALKAAKVENFRVEQLRRAIFVESASAYEDISVLPAAIRKTLSAAAPLLSFSLDKLSVSGDRRAHKALCKLKDGRLVETVLLRPSPTRWTTCISCQVGCAVKCPFCATGLMGFSRNLTCEEITDQVLFWRQYIKKEGLEGRLDNVVYMGMGEPFAAYDLISESLRQLMDQRLFAIGARHIAVSTSGIAPKIERFGVDFPQVNLAISLHAADDETRSRLVPLNKTYPLASLRDSIKTYMTHSSRKVFLEYVLLKGVNDGEKNARDLIAYVRDLGPGERLHVNLICFNQTNGDFSAPSEPEARGFQKKLLDAGLKATLRQNLGRDIDGACGQLASQPAGELK
jgi:23S rRNA (adenine(2503)-C(2))-methyltransferase